MAVNLFYELKIMLTGNSIRVAIHYNTNEQNLNILLSLSND